MYWLYEKINKTDERLERWMKKERRYKSQCHEFKMMIYLYIYRYYKYNNVIIQKIF